MKIKKVKENATLPTKGSVSAAGFDLYACLDAEATIPPRQGIKVPTGVAAAIPFGFFGGIYARSGLATKQGLRPCNCTGVIDADYRGEIIVALFNDSNEERTIAPNDRIAQLVIQPYADVNLEEAETLDETDRGEGGFGSTGI